MWENGWSARLPDEIGILPIDGFGEMSSVTIATQVLNALGGSSVVGRIDMEYDLVDAVREGSPAQALDDLIARGMLAAEEIDLLVIPRRTLTTPGAR